jgi:hypothetical protein
MAIIERELIKYQPEPQIHDQLEDIVDNKQAVKKPKLPKAKNVLRKASGALAISGLITIPTTLIYSGLQSLRLAGQELNINFEAKHGTEKFIRGTEETENKIGFGMDAAKASAAASVVGIVVYSAISRKDNASISASLPAQTKNPSA